MAKIGVLWGISAGPGDPELLTVKAVRRLQTCSVVAFPAGRDGHPGIAQIIIQPWLQPAQTQLALTFPFVQTQDVLEAAWETAAAQVWRYLAEGRDVAFATEGDASFYSTFTYLARSLQRQHPEVSIQTVPGVCSPLAAVAQLGKPLTIWQQQLVVLPALYAIADFEAALNQADVVVLMKVASVYSVVWSVLQRRQLLHRSHVVVRATQSEERIYSDLRHHADLQLPYFSLMIIYCGQTDSAAEGNT